MKLCSHGARARVGALGVGRVRMLRAAEGASATPSMRGYREAEGDIADTIVQ